MSSKLKAATVVAGAIVLSTFGIHAGDVLQGVERNLPGLAIESSGPCGTDARLLQFGTHAICVDVYEASPGDACPHADPQNEIQTRENLEADGCYAASESAVIPWRFVTLTQAQQLCARAGKRLPTNDEWYKAALGLENDDSCATDTRAGRPEETGSVACVTQSGVHDLVGNVWEWVEGEVVDGTYNGRVLPEEGYITLVDGTGVVAETGDTPSTDFGEDYVWTDTDGLRGMLRGGFYGSGSDAGIFALNAAVPLDFRTAGVGFRCVRDI